MPHSRLRVTHVIPQIGIGGAETQLCHLVSKTPEDRVEHRVLYYSDARDEEGLRLYRTCGVRFSRVARSRALPHVFLWRLARAIRDGRPDIVHCWLPGAAFWGRWAATLAGAERIVLSIRSTHVAFVGLLQVSRLMDGRRIRYLVNSTGAAQTVERVIGAPRGRITLIPNGIDLAAPEAPAPRDRLLGDHGCPPGSRIVLSVGRLTELKNYPMLLRIAARLRDRVPVHFFIAGHGELDVDLREQARALGIDDRVHFLGLRLDVRALLRSADLFCYTSRSEGLPNALLEAMAAGLPIVTTRFAGVEDIAEQGVTARIVASDDDQAASVAIATLLADPAAAAALGAAARRSAEERFSMQQMVERTLGYYGRIMENLA